MKKPSKPDILIIDDEVKFCNSLEMLLEKNGYCIHIAHSAKEGSDILRKVSIDLIICDIVMPEISGLMLLSRIANQVPVVMVTAYASIETTRKAFKLGACDYLVKPINIEELKVVIDQNLRNRANQEDSTNADHFFESSNANFLKVLDYADKFSATDIPVMICGESGTGKEILANFIFQHSNRKSFPFVKINCAAIPETLLESELFGYEKGAFTGAIDKKIGKFEEANGGTLFFDEIGDMSFNLQPKILRVLQEYEICHLGGNKSIKVDVRIISASNQSLKNLINNGKFRSDLFHRLNGIYLDLPPLRERKEDIERLSLFFIMKFNIKYGKEIKRLDADAIRICTEYYWPGNIRELKNYLERAVVICEGQYLAPDHLPDCMMSVQETEVSFHEASIAEQMDEYRIRYTKQIILDALKRTKGNREEAARILNISRKTLYNWMKSCSVTYE